MNELKRIGYWRQSEYEKSDLPWPEEGRLSNDTKLKIVKFLDSGKTYDVYKGCSYCRVCGKTNGTQDMINEGFIYPEGYAHYIIDHNINPDIDLLYCVLKKGRD